MRLIALLILATLAWSPMARAHPHVWIDATTEFLAAPDGGAIGGLEITWTFDEFYSAYSAEGFDQDGDGKPDPEFLDAMVGGAMQSLREWIYYADLRLDGDRLEWGEVIGRSASWKDGQLIYTFSLALTEPVPLGKAGDLTLRLYDPTYYISVLLKEDPNAVTVDPRLSGCAPSVHEPEGIREVMIADAIAMAEDIQPGEEGLGYAYSQEIGVRCE